jgi:uncharacterized Zn finger protein
MTTYKFLIQGSSSQPYETLFYVTDNNISGTCTCSAGINGQSCKHRLNILSGDTKGIISGNESDVELVRQAFKNTPLESKLNQLAEIEKDMEDIKKRINETKKEIARIFAGK